MSKKQIRGLLDYMEAINSGEDWELAPMSETFVLGMGLGASATATRWAYKGYLSELSVEITAFKNRAGRKKLAQYDGVDCKRAYAIWWYLYQLRYPNNRSLKNRHLIEHMQRCGKYGLVTVLFRSFDSISCSKGDKLWDNYEQTNFAKMRCALL